MKEFTGFPARTRFTPVPDPFFTQVLPQIEDAAEIRITLHIFWLTYRKKGYPRFTTFRELASDPTLAKQVDEETILRALERAVQRGTLLHLEAANEGETEHLYFLNTEADRRAVDRIMKGELEVGEFPRVRLPQAAEKPNVFQLYENNIGMLSPIIAEELKLAEELYPASWIEDAFKEAVNANKRNWKYISRILERWAVEGKDDGAYRRHPQTGPGPEEYRRRYGHLLKK